MTFDSKARVPSGSGPSSGYWLLLIDSMPYESCRPIDHFLWMRSGIQQIIIKSTSHFNFLLSFSFQTMDSGSDLPHVFMEGDTSSSSSVESVSPVANLRIDSPSPAGRENIRDQWNTLIEDHQGEDIFNSNSHVLMLGVDTHIFFFFFRI